MTSGDRDKFIYWLDEITKDDDELVGKKSANLGEMTRSGFKVPSGFALSLAAYDRFMNESGALGEVNEYLSHFRADANDLGDLPKWAEASDAIRGIVEAKPVPEGMRERIAAYYEELCQRTGVANCPVATRSAGPVSHPGQYETFLHVKGLPEVLQHIVRVWASTFNQSPLVARARGECRLDYDPIGVAVLQMLNPKAAGVMFTLNPANGDRSKIMIEGNWGLGESVVSGSVTPDGWLIDKVVFEVISRTVSPKQLEYVVDLSGKVVRTSIEPDRQNIPCLTDGEALELARGGKRIEQHYGVPQDIEWVVDKDLPFPENVFFVQTRPETIWSKKEAKSKLKTTGSVTGDVIHFWRNIKG